MDDDVDLSLLPEELRHLAPSRRSTPSSTSTWRASRGALQDVALALDSFAQAALEARFVLDTRSTEATTIPDVNPAAM